MQSTHELIFYNNCGFGICFIFLGFSSQLSPFFVIGNGAQKAAEQLKEVLISGGSLFVFIFALHEQHLSWIAFLLGDNEKIVPKFLFRGDFLFLTFPYLSPFIFSIFAVVGECFLAWRDSGWVSRYCLPYKRCSFCMADSFVQGRVVQS